MVERKKKIRMRLNLLIRPYTISNFLEKLFGLPLENKIFWRYANIRFYPIEVDKTGYPLKDV